jgi:hypothetical protein
MFCENGATTVVVFSHPNHEIAIFGLLQRLKPHLVYLTDGGGEKRVEQTRQGLKSIDLLDRAHFLNYTENSFYEALLTCDFAFYEKVASQVQALFQVIRPLQVLCDTIEFYNPLHDMSLPIVRAALRKSASAEIFEVPLVYQKPAETEAYELQRMPASRRGEQIEFQLSQQELAAKVSARDQIYTILIEPTGLRPPTIVPQFDRHPHVTLGALILALPLTHIALEVIAPACSSLPTPDGEQVLRYEQRAQILRERGKIEREITYAQHYQPVAMSLFDNSNASDFSQLQNGT